MKGERDAGDSEVRKSSIEVKKERERNTDEWGTSIHKPAVTMTVRRCFCSGVRIVSITSLFSATVSLLAAAMNNL